MVHRNTMIEWAELPLPGDAGALCEWFQSQPGMDHGLARAAALRGINRVVGGRARIIAPQLCALRTPYDECERWPKNLLAVEPGWPQDSPVRTAYARAWDRFVHEIGPDPSVWFAYLDDFGIDAPEPEPVSVLAIPVQGTLTSIDTAETCLPQGLRGKLRATAESCRCEFNIRMHPAAWRLANRWAREWRGDYDPADGWRVRLLKAIVPVLALTVDGNKPIVAPEMVIVARDLVEGCDLVEGYVSQMLSDLNDPNKVVPLRPRTAGTPPTTA